MFIRPADDGGLWGAINALMAEIIEGHIRFNVVDPDRKPTLQQTRAAQEVIDVVNAYLK